MKKLCSGILDMMVAAGGTSSHSCLNQGSHTRYVSYGSMSFQSYGYSSYYYPNYCTCVWRIWAPDARYIRVYRYFMDVSQDLLKFMVLILVLRAGESI